MRDLGKLEVTPTSHLPPSLCYLQAQGESKAMTVNLCEIRQLSLAVSPDPSPNPRILEILAPEGRGSTKQTPSLDTLYLCILLINFLQLGNTPHLAPGAGS